MPATLMHFPLRNVQVLRRQVRGGSEPKLLTMLTLLGWDVLMLECLNRYVPKSDISLYCVFRGDTMETKPFLKLSEVHPPRPSVNVDQSKKKTVKLLLKIALYILLD